MKIILVFISIQFSISILNAQWTQSKGPTGCTVYCIIAEGQNLFVGTELNGLFLSTDNGETWSRITTSSITGISSLVINRSELYVGTPGSGIFRSTNYGVTWTELKNGVPSQYINTISLHLNNLYIGTSQGIFFSSDKGTSWHSKNNGLPQDTLIFHSRPGVIDTALSRNAKVIISYGLDLFSSIGKHGIFFSSDQGSSWLPRNNGLPENPEIVTLTNNDSGIYLGTSKGEIFYSVDKGTSWKLIGNSLSTPIFSLIADATSIYAATGDGIFVSTNQSNWQPINNGLPNKYVRTVAANFDYLFTSAEKRGIYRTGKNQLNWERKSIGFPFKLIFSLYNDGRNLYAGTDSGVYVSYDNGITWLPKSDFTGQIYLITGSGLTLFAVEYGFVYKSIDQGNSWVKISDGLPGADIKALVVDGNIIYAGTWCCGVYISKNGGTNWESLTPNLFNIYVNTMIKYGNNLFVGVNGGFYQINLSNNNSIYKPMQDDFYSLIIHKGKLIAGTLTGIRVLNEADGIWEYSNSGIPINMTISNLFTVGSRIYAYTISESTSDLYLSIDDGKTWHTIKPQFPYPDIVSSFSANENDLFIGTINKGVWRCSISEIISSVEQQEFPTTYSLSQNYPNPFNPSTTIKYTIPSNVKGETVNVTMKVYDVLGREVATLVDEAKAPGTYEVTFNAGHAEQSRSIPSGIYFYRLQSGTYSQTRKLILLK